VLRTRTQKLIGFNAKRQSQAFNIVDRDISGLSLNMRDKGSV